MHSLLASRRPSSCRTFTPATKITRTAAWGAEVVLHGETLAEAAAHAAHLAETRQTGLHPSL